MLVVRVFLLLLRVRLSRGLVVAVVVVGRAFRLRALVVPVGAGLETMLLVQVWLVRKTLVAVGVAGMKPMSVVLAVPAW